MTFTTAILDSNEAICVAVALSAFLGGCFIRGVSLDRTKRAAVSTVGVVTATVLPLIGLVRTIAVNQGAVSLALGTDLVIAAAVYTGLGLLARVALDRTKSDGTTPTA